MCNWLLYNEAKAMTGRLILGYLGRAMEGEISGDIDEWRDLSLQIHDLAATLHQAVAALEFGLRWYARRT